MYIPKHNIMKEDDVFDFIEINSFGILITQNEKKLTGTHIPFLLKRKEGSYGKLICHIAKANRQWKDLSGEVLVIFPGPHKYISPSWYETDQAVPTWNYLSVHLYGEIKIIEDRDKKINAVRELVEMIEPEKERYSMDNLKPEYFEGLLKGIVVFEIAINSIEGKEKISQNHSAERQLRIIENLIRDDDPDAEKIADRMKLNLFSKMDGSSGPDNIP
ncbi:MAG: FMN-binding negative transcriptional regulator [Ignavibacteria bacterium]|nr:FMN-binding negative transcriptional regulator [Ignavibacteria bacterium]